MEIRWSTDARPDPGSACWAMQQDPAWGDACAALGAGVLRAEIRAEGARIGTAQLVTRRLPAGLRLALCTRGPVWAEGIAPATRAEALAALARSLPLLRPRFLLATPEGGAAEAGALSAAGHRRVMTPAATALLDLDRPLAGIRAGLPKRWRNRLVAAEAAGLSIRRETGRPGRWDWLLAAEAAQARARGYRSIPVAMVPAFAASGGAVRLLEARRDGARIAGMIFLRHGRRATWHIGWTSDIGRATRAHARLLWEAVAMLRDEGVTCLDLGGIDTEGAPGIARFKLGTGARPLVLNGTWLLRPGRRRAA